MNSSLRSDANTIIYHMNGHNGGLPYCLVSESGKAPRQKLGCGEQWVSRTAGARKAAKAARMG